MAVRSLFLRDVLSCRAGEALIVAGQPTVLAAWIANNVESIIGATAQGKQGLGWLTNEVVNFINTLVGAAAAIGLCLLTGAV